MNKTPLEKFHERLKNGGNLIQEKKPISKEYKAYLDKLDKNPLHTPGELEIQASIFKKLNKRAKGGRFLATEKQSNLMNKLYQYFLGKGDFDVDKGIMLIGNYGCGKTEIMKAFVNTNFKPYNPALISNPCINTSAINMVEYYNSDQNFNKYFENNLYVDDLGSEQRAKYMSKDDDPILSKFFELWYMRRGDKRLFLTSNINKEELSSKYGGRVYSRLNQLCNFITLNEKDFRI